MGWKRRVGRVLRRHLPRTFYWIQYHRMLRNIEDRTREKHALFRDLIASASDKPCLQIGVRDAKYAPHWTSVDRYDRAAYIDYADDIHDLQFADGTFDIVVCNAILEHVEDPQRAIRELRRVLKIGGRIWVEVPFLFPYHPAPEDYWRVTLSGLRIW